MKEKISKTIDDSIRAKGLVKKTQIANIEKAARIILSSLKSDGKLMVFGNGGSAADSQHIVAELVGRFKKERKAIAAMALTTNTSTLTAIANDYGYDVTFSRQIEALGRKGDVALGISTSGNSKNVVEALEKAVSMGIATVGLSGGDGGKMRRVCDILISVGLKDTPRIQESHIMIGHIICEVVEEELCK
ncbi:MAG: D-sedoheptulose 7-phosphate isomerase [Candidatus Omnitrophota bacterium]|nr:D-sedoheptulose 7-phosphate isomerase [Candidatus Omnitrophota bacterium]